MTASRGDGLSRSRRVTTLLVLGLLAPSGSSRWVRSPTASAAGSPCSSPMGIIMLACGVLASLSLWIVVRPRDVPPIE